MPNRLFHTAVSAPRFNKYLNACHNNKRKALKLYRANLALSEKLYSVIGIFEIILRNSILRPCKIINLLDAAQNLIVVKIEIFQHACMQIKHPSMYNRKFVL